METISAAIATIVTIPAIIWKSEHSDRDDRDDRDDRSDHMRPAIWTIPAIYGNQSSAIVMIAAIECFQWLQRS